MGAPRSARGNDGTILRTCRESSARPLWYATANGCGQWAHVADVDVYALFTSILFGRSHHPARRRATSLEETMGKLAEIGGARFPFLRWSVLRMILGARNLLTYWQVGDGREEALARHVIAHARAGDLDDVINVIDDFYYRERFMMNVGDEKRRSSIER